MNSLLSLESCLSRTTRAIKQYNYSMIRDIEGEGEGDGVWGGVREGNICKLTEKLKYGKVSGPDDIRAESLRFFMIDCMHCYLYVFPHVSHIFFCHTLYLKLPLYVSLKLHMAA